MQCLILSFQALDKPYLVKDKIVLDVGSGTGIPSIFAAKVKKVRKPIKNHLLISSLV